MKIISKFKDYYDSANYASHDASMGVYVRHTSKHDIDWIGYSCEIDGVDASHKLVTGIIGFCGKIYPYIWYHTYNKKSYPGAPPDTSKYIFSFEEFTKLRTKLTQIKQTSRYGYGCGYHKMFVDQVNNQDIAKLWFNCDFSTLMQYIAPYYRARKDGSTRKYPKLNTLFIEHKVPYFAITKNQHNREYILTINPNLEKYTFYKVVDAYTAFQEIEMFMNNVIISPDDPFIEPISDEIKAESHGFNKFSFRRAKKKKGNDHGRIQ